MKISVKQRILDGVAKNGHHCEPLLELLTTDFQTEYRPGGRRGPLLIAEWCREQGLKSHEFVMHVGKQPQIGVKFESALSSERRIQGEMSKAGLNA